MTAAPVSPLTVAGPPRLLRLPIYLFAWLPVFVSIFFLVPSFEPVFFTLKEKGEHLPSLSKLFVTFSLYDEISYHILSVLVFVGLLSLDEAMCQVLRSSRRGPIWVWVWFAFVLFSGLYLFGMILFAMVLLVIRL